MALCGLTIIFDGYDLIVYGAVLPALLSYEPWGLTPVQAGAIGSYALIGMLIGALVVGTITDIVGRRKIMLFCITWFSLAMGLCAMAPSAELFGFFRFIAGLGLGGVVPTAIALTIEYAPPDWRTLANSIMFSGYSVGGILAALLAIVLLPDFGFRTMFWIGLLPLVTLVPLAWKFLPESVGFLAANGRWEEAEALARRYGLPLEREDASSPAASAEGQGRLAALSSLFSRSYVVPTLLFWFATFIGLLLVYGFNTWLPQIMREAGYPLGSALSFLLVLNLGAILGTPVAGALADRFGRKRVTTICFLAAAMCIGLLSFPLPVLGLYALVAVAGLGTIGTTILVNAYCAQYYPAGSRATGLGWALGIGRLGAILGPIFGGFIAASQLGFEWNFYAFAVLAVLGGLLILLVPRSPTERPSAPAEERVAQTI
ncbi:MFS transporter [Rubrobacter marinus]|uniref:MFS transporter n=1 Tax=Rubrobacter marinus TaxID=2653852 RepID=A0A6G8Q344_9ACTN|nr:MFS transporter [Rubrobacter marinus]